MSKASSTFSSLAVRFSERTKSLTHLFIRQHKLDPAEESAGGGLFVTGLPLLDHPLQAALEALFSSFGKVASLVVHHSQLSALVVFAEEGSAGKVLKAAALHSIVDVSLVESGVPNGLKGWVQAHKARFPGNAVLRQQLDDWMEAFEKQEQEARAAATAAADDGWTVVTRKPGRRKTTDPVSSIAVAGISQAVAEARAAKKPVKQLENFYRHQKRDKQRADLLTLQQKFEEDKRKIAEMRASRRFKPY